MSYINQKVREETVKADSEELNIVCSEDPTIPKVACNSGLKILAFQALPLEKLE